MAEVDTPAPDADEVLVKVLGASVNAADQAPQAAACYLSPRSPEES
jgi:NADPH:quinone reductase-like Zn-dependent oxidoreductase